MASLAASPAASPGSSSDAPMEALPWAENHDVNSRVLPSLTPREQAIARTVCHQWNDTCAARPSIRAGELPIGELGKYIIISSMAWSPEGDLVGVGFNNGSFRAFRTDEGHREVAMPDMCSPISTAVCEIAFSAGGPADVLVAYANFSGDATLRVRSGVTGIVNTLCLPIQRNESVDHIAFAPGSTAARFKLACTVIDRVDYRYSAVYVWWRIAGGPLMRGRYWRFPRDGSVFSVHHCSFSNDGRKLAVTTTASGYDEDEGEFADDDTLRIYDNRNACTSTIKFKGTIRRPSWSPDDEWVATVTDDARDGEICFAYVNSAGPAQAGAGRDPKPGAACLAAGPLRGASAFLFCHGHAEFVVASGAAPVTKTFDPRALPERDMHAVLSPDGAAFAVVLNGGRVRIVRFN